MTNGSRLDTIATRPSSRHRRMRRLPAIAAALLFAACQTTSAPERRDLVGSWVSDDVPDVVIRMTLAETARSVDGAGFWSTAIRSDAFRVTGGLAGDEVALYLDFDLRVRDDLTFQGHFTDDDIIEGSISGGGFSETTATFERQDLDPN